MSQPGLLKVLLQAAVDTSPKWPLVNVGWEEDIKRGETKRSERHQASLILPSVSVVDRNYESKARDNDDLKTSPERHGYLQTGSFWLVDRFSRAATCRVRSSISLISIRTGILDLDSCVEIQCFAGGFF
jgi:hypothetical protein